MYDRRRFVAIAVVAACLTLGACSGADLFPDSSLTVPPDRISDASLRYDGETGDAVLAWTSPRPNGGTTALRRYEIRFSYDTEFDWEAAVPVIGAPAPAGVGTRQECHLRDVEPGRTLRAAIRSIDTSGNVSETSNTASMLVPGFRVSGLARDVFTREPIAGLEVSVVGIGVARSTVTDEAGRYSLDDLPIIEASVRLTTNAASQSYYTVEYHVPLFGDTALSPLMIPVRASTVRPGDSMLALFKQAMGVGNGGSALRKWPAQPVDLYIPEFVNEYGIDYRAHAIFSALRWMDLTGLQLFQLVDSPPETGVVMFFKSPADMGYQNGVTVHTNTPDGTPLRSDVNIIDSINNPAVVDRIMIHELGHTLRLQHLPAGFMMYSGLPLPEQPTDDEVWIVQLLHAMPDRTNLSIYRELSQ